MKPTTFIGSSSEGLDIARQVQSELQDVTWASVWTQGVFVLGNSTIESLMQQIAEKDFAIMVFTPDDVVISREISKFAPRDNVIFELGLFMGRLGPKRAFVLYADLPNLKFLTDLQNVTRAPYDVAWAQHQVASAIGAACQPIREAIKREGYLAPTDDTVMYGNKIGLLTFDYYYVQTDMNDQESKLRAVDRPHIGTWETFELIDPNDEFSPTTKRPIRFGDVVGLKGANNRYIGADLDNQQNPLIYAWEPEYIDKQWGKFRVQPLTTETGIKIGDFVRYGSPLTLQAWNNKYVAFQSLAENKYLWAKSDTIGGWERFIIVRGAQ